jgi:hypothetical protein
LYLGLDLGTSELKALLLAPDHRIVALARAPLTVDRPAPLWSEQAPSQWWEALEAAMAELRRTQAAALSAVRAIGLSGQMHFLEQIEGYKESDDLTQVYLLRKALYGLKQSARCCNIDVDRVLRLFGFIPVRSEPCLYVLRKDPRVSTQEGIESFKKCVENDKTFT